MSLQRKSFLQFYCLLIVFKLFQKNLLPGETVDIDEAEQTDDAGSEFGRIRCPLCQWQPDAHSLWCCDDCGHPEYFFDSCGAIWNTFKTRGVCPGCGHLWRWTSCLRCYEWSLHEDWYAVESGKNQSG